MDRMLRKLRVISEVNQPSNYSPIDMVQLVDNTLKEFRFYIEMHSILLVVECDSATTFSSYPGLIETILHNLLDNALFFSSIEKQRPPMVKITAQLHDNMLTLVVHDNGVGIEEAVITKLWDMFFVGNSYSKGNGLGLYVVAKAVYALNGTVEVASNVNSFTSFTITVPVNTMHTSSLLLEPLETASVS